MKGEHPINVVRQHPFVLIPYLLALLPGVPVASALMGASVALALLAAAAVIVTVFHSHARRRTAPWATILTVSLIATLVIPGPVVLTLVAGGALAIRWLTWHQRTYTLTNRRVISQHGVLTQTGETFLLKCIQHVTVRRSGLGGLVGDFGDIVIHVSGSSQSLRQIAGVDVFHAQLMHAVAGV